MKPARVGLIGFGAIGRCLCEYFPRTHELVGVLTRTPLEEGIANELPASVANVQSIDDLLALEPAVIVECAGQAALRQYAETVLNRGLDLIAISTGALADEAFLDRLLTTARRTNTHLRLPAGAIAGIDGLAALARGGLTSVTYTSIKPPAAWRGTLADKVEGFETKAEAIEFFSGDAYAAAREFPRNANIAATVALAGAGFAKTLVRLISDPEATVNTGRIEAQGDFGSLTVEVAGPAAATNPRTSAVTALSIAHVLELTESCRFSERRG